MMLDGGEDGSLELHIIGHGGGGADPAWLTVRVMLSWRQGTHSGEDDCLERDEDRELATWLLMIDEKREPKPTLLDPTPAIAFTEPYLAFEILEAQENSVRMRTWLGRPFLPPWVERAVEGLIVPEGNEMEFTVDRPQLQVAGRAPLSEWESVTRSNPEDAAPSPL